MNIDGTYKSDDSSFVLNINASSEANGTFGGTCVSNNTPQGAQTLAVTGRFAYVGSPATPCSFAFISLVRPEGGRPFGIQDAWSGVMTSVGKLKMSGTRSYLLANGNSELSDLGTHTFST